MGTMSGNGSERRIDAVGVRNDSIERAKFFGTVQSINTADQSFIARITAADDFIDIRVAVRPGTAITINGKKGDFSAITVGAQVNVAGIYNDSTNVTAQKVAVTVKPATSRKATIKGSTLLGVNSDGSFRVSVGDTTIAVRFDSSTKISINNRASTAAFLVVGMTMDVSGAYTDDTQTVLQATSIKARTPR